MVFKHITFVVKDIERSVEFYKEFTELKVLRRYSEGPAELAFLADAEGDTEIELVQVPGMRLFEGGGFFLCFITDDLEGKRALALERGLNPSDIRSPDDKTRYFYVYDPDGVSIQLKRQLP